jgi:hypothetical protein
LRETEIDRTAWPAPDAAVTILNTSGMNDRVQQQTLHVDENMSFLAFDQFARIEPVRINAGPPFSVHALAVDDASGGAGLSFRLLAAFDVQCMIWIRSNVPSQCHHVK